MKNSFIAFIAEEGGRVISDVIRLRMISRPKVKEAAEGAPTIEKEAGKSSGVNQNIATEPKTAPTASTAPETTLEAHSLDYQLDRILDELQHLETEHLPTKGRLDGAPCDCIAKAARDLRRHARETIPIAAREGKDATIFSAIADEANYLMEIGTADAVRSGQYDAEYLKHSGVVSDFRKSVDKMLAEVKSRSSSGCPECEELRRLSRQWLERRAAQEGTKVEQPASES